MTSEINTAARGCRNFTAASCMDTVVFDALMRRVILQALARGCGGNLRVEAGVGSKHPETFEIGSSVCIGSQAHIQGRFDGTCKIGDFVWIGPQSYFDARDLILEDHVDWCPGVNVLGSVHTEIPTDVPVIQTDLKIKPVRIREWADIGNNSVILPAV